MPYTGVHRVPSYYGIIALSAWREHHCGANVVHPHMFFIAIISYVRSSNTFCTGSCYLVLDDKGNIGYMCESWVDDIICANSRTRENNTL